MHACTVDLGPRKRLVNYSKVASDKICHVSGAIFLPYCIESRLVIF